MAKPKGAGTIGKPLLASAEAKSFFMKVYERMNFALPKAPPRPCRYPGCPGFCAPGQVFCNDHIMWSGDHLRGNADARGYDAMWRKARKAFLQAHPLCVECMKAGRLTPATVVDHVVPHRGDVKLFWDEGNWQALCKACHGKKTGLGL